MRASISAGSATLLLATVCFAANAGVRGSGRRASEGRSVGTFEAVAVHSGIRAEVSLGETAVEVTADDNILPLVRTEVRGGVLEIGFEPHSHLWSTSRVEVRVRTPRLRAIEASGGSEARVEALNGDEGRASASGGGHLSLEKAGARDLKIRASGGATVEASRIDASSLDAAGSGGAVLKLSGRAQKAELRFSGGTTVEAGSLQVGELGVRGSGGGDARLGSAETIRGSLSGGSTVHVGGSPRTRVSTSGGAEVVVGGRPQGDRHQRGHRDHDQDDDED